MADKKAAEKKTKSNSTQAEKKAACNTSEKCDATKKKTSVGVIIAAIVAIAAITAAIIVAIVMNSALKVVGKYELSAIVVDGEESTGMVDLLKAFGGNYTIEFKDDKTGVLEMKVSGFETEENTGENAEGGEESKPIKFTYTDKKITMTEDGEVKEVDYEYADDTVKVTVDGQVMKFVRKK